MILLIKRAKGNQTDVKFFPAETCPPLNLAKKKAGGQRKSLTTGRKVDETGKIVEINLSGFSLNYGT